MSSSERNELACVNFIDSSSSSGFEKPDYIFNNVRTCAGLYIKNGQKLKNDFHALYKGIPDSR